MIYFNVYKNACMQPIENPICIITDELWEDFKYLTLGKDYDIIDGVFTDLRETEENIAQRFAEEKREKFAENDKKANAVLAHTFEIEVGEDKTPCKFIYNEKTERNLNSSALGFITNQYDQKEWTDEEGKTVYLSAEDVAVVLLTFNEFANGIWAKWGEYYRQIEQAETVEEVRSIEITYD